MKEGSGTSILLRLVDQRTDKMAPDATLFLNSRGISPYGERRLVPQAVR